MSFLEKTLETIIWENYEACEERGLNIAQGFFKFGSKHRQLNLAPYGIADLVNIRYYAPEEMFYIQVIELKKGKVDTAAYLQAKRYQTALQGVVLRAFHRLKKEPRMHFSTVLIGDEVEKAGDFVFALNADFACQAFVYSYGFDGIHFEDAGKEWAINNAGASSQLALLASELVETAGFEDGNLAHSLALQQANRVAAKLEFGDYEQALIITPTGITLNPSIDGVYEEAEGEYQEEEGGVDGAE